MLFISFIFIPAFPLRVAGAAALGGLAMPNGQQQFQMVLLALHHNETKQGQRFIHSTKPWMTSELIFRGFTQQKLPRQSSVGHSGHMAKPIYLCALNSEEKWFHIQGSANFTAAHFVAKCHTMDSSQKSHLCHLPLR